MDREERLRRRREQYRVRPVLDRAEKLQKREREREREQRLEARRARERRRRDVYRAATNVVATEKGS